MNLSKKQHPQQRIYCTIVIVLLILPSFLFSQTNNDSLKTLVNKLGNDFINNQKAVGLSVGVYNNGQINFYNFGTVEKGKPILPTENTVYEIGSITKTFVSYILAYAVIRYKIKLDDDIRKYLKESFPNLEYKGHPITIAQLANTTSLLPDWLPEPPAEMKGLSPDAALEAKTEYYKHLSRRDFYKALHNVKLDTIPGTKRSHSNAGAQLLGYIVEDAMFMPMDKLVEKYITRPERMKNTSFVSSAKEEGLAIGYTASDKPAQYEFAMPYFKNAGGLSSSTYDLVTYIKLMLDKDHPVSTTALTKTVDVDASSNKVVPLHPDGTAAPDFYSVALSWFKYQPDANNTQVWADGGTNGFNSYLVLYPNLNSGIVLLANKSDEKIFNALPGMAYQISKVLGKK